MKRRITRAAVLGSGTMGSGIAAHLANAGIKSYLLDIVPKELNEQEKKKGLGTESPAFRNRIAESNKQRLLKSKPPQLMNPADADMITVGNMEDNLEWLSECDWVIEVVPEKMEIKDAVFEKICPYLRPGAILSSNTSGLSVNCISEKLPAGVRKNFLGTHFFNPVRYMKLLEIIPTKETSQEIVEFMADFGERVLGKGIVLCKDTPNFIANRLGVFLGISFNQKAEELGLTVEETDAIAGPAMGRPRTAVFGLQDMVGLDVALVSGETVYNSVSEKEKPFFLRPPWFSEMCRRGLLGNKTNGGFYRTVNGEKQAIDLKTLEYRPVQKPSFDSVNRALKAGSLVEKMKIFYEADDLAARFVWKQQRDFFLYAAGLLGEISDDILNMDRALRWGYNLSAGPFEMWNGLDLAKYVARMEQEGCDVPRWVREMLESGVTSFYRTVNGIEEYYSAGKKGYVPVEQKPGAVLFEQKKAQGQMVHQTDAAEFYDLGDGVLGLRLTEAVLTGRVLDALEEAHKRLNADWDGMVITGSGRHFISGNDMKFIHEQIGAKNWDAVGAYLKRAQDLFQAFKYSDKPIVAATHGKTLAGGCELAMQATAVEASLETQFGLDAIRAGLIPAMGGIKEMTVRALGTVKGTPAFVLDFLTPWFTNLQTAKTSSSAKDALSLGYLRTTDRMTRNPDDLVGRAKARVLDLLEENYTAPVCRKLEAPGLSYIGPLLSKAENLMWSKAISEHDCKVLKAAVRVMAGAPVVSKEPITEQYLLDCEREAFLSLCGEPKTQERITALAAGGKPPRN